MAKKQKLGTVQRTSPNTARIRVDRMLRHPLYLKAYRSSKSFVVHVPQHIKVNVGDQVTIEEMRPVSKRKAWVVVNVAQPQINADQSALLSEQISESAASEDQ